MIVRILHEGQYEVPPEALGQIRRSDDEMMASLVAGDEQWFAERRDQLLTLVRSEGKVVADNVLRESELVLPHADITLAEARELFTQIS